MLISLSRPEFLTTVKGHLSFSSALYSPFITLWQLKRRPSYFSVYSKLPAKYLRRKQAYFGATKMKFFSLTSQQLYCVEKTERRLLSAVPIPTCVKTPALRGQVNTPPLLMAKRCKSTFREYVVVNVHSIILHKSPSSPERWHLICHFNSLTVCASYVCEWKTQNNKTFLGFGKRFSLW